MNDKERFYPETLFGGFTDIDGTVAFFNRVNSLSTPLSQSSRDVGCERGEYNEDPVPLRKNLRILKGKVAKVIGIDVDQGPRESVWTSFNLIQGNSWPVQSNSIDLIVCDNVLEHIADPDRFFLEIHRVLRNGGYLCIRTPNRWSYVAIAATLIPNRFHSKVTTFVQDGRKEEDVFPTVYRCNSILET